MADYAISPWHCANLRLPPRSAARSNGKPIGRDRSRSRGRKEAKMLRYLVISMLLLISAAQAADPIKTER